MSKSTSLLAEGFRQAVEAWLGRLRSEAIPYSVNSTRRSTLEQRRLYDRFLRGESDFPVARPGTSTHELGRAIDVSFESDEELLYAADLAADFGIAWAGAGDLVHFEDTILTAVPPPPQRDAEAVVQAAIASGSLQGPRASTFGPTGIIGNVLSFFGLGDADCPT